jgi:hypothetical protein
MPVILLPNVSKSWDRVKQGRVRVAAQLAASGRPSTSSALRAQLRGASLIVVGQGRRLGLAAVDFAVDGGAAEVQLASNLRAAEFGLYEGLDRDSVSHRDVRVVSSHLGDTLQVAPCCTSKLSRPSILISRGGSIRRYFNQ